MVALFEGDVMAALKQDVFRRRSVKVAVVVGGLGLMWAPFATAAIPASGLGAISRLQRVSQGKTDVTAL